ncbi:hypothetical protein AB1N83_010199 [Pleurotus pulmonarius]
MDGVTSHASLLNVLEPPRRRYLRLTTPSLQCREHGLLSRRQESHGRSSVHKPLPPSAEPQVPGTATATANSRNDQSIARSATFWLNSGAWSRAITGGGVQSFTAGDGETARCLLKHVFDMVLPFSRHFCHKPTM